MTSITARVYAAIVATHKEGDCFTRAQIQDVNYNTLSSSLCDLRDMGLIEFVARGSYRLIDATHQFVGRKRSRGEAALWEEMHTPSKRSKRLKLSEQAPVKGTKLRYDLYIERESKAGEMLRYGVEFQGRQHYEPVKWSSKWSEEETLRQFKKGLERDEIKRRVSKENDIIHVEIDYRKVTNSRGHILRSPLKKIVNKTIFTTPKKSI